MKGDELMKMKGLCRRSLSLLLVAVMVVSMLPVSVFAAVGDIISSEDIGFDADTLDKSDVINWPVKIYDYLNDGMLFEPANSRADTASAAGMVYGGGAVMPSTAVGTDFTTSAGSSSYSYTWSSASDVAAKSNYALSMVPAVRFESPKYMHVSYPGTGTSNYKYLMLHSFTKGNTLSEVAKANIQYMVLVYRANGRDSDERIDIQLEHYSSQYLYYGYQDSDTLGLPIQDTDTWTYLVVDLAAALGESRWGSFSTVSGVYMLSDMVDSGDYIDLSHVAFFDNAVEAKNYGEDAVAFDNEPGEHLEVTQTITLAAGTPTYYIYPTVSEPGYDLSLNHANMTTPSVSEANGTSDTKKRYGMNFALATGQTMATYGRWSQPTELDLYTGSSWIDFTPSSMKVQSVDEGSQDFVKLSSAEASSNIILSEFIEGSSVSTTHYVSYDTSAGRVRYLILVYRANGYTTSDEFGIWLSGYSSGGYVDGSTTCVTSSFPSGKTTNFSLATYNGTTVSDGWVSAVIDLWSISSLRYIKYVGMNFPTGSGKSLDLAYVAYFPDETGADSFATDATAYMNQGIKVQTGVSGASTKTIKAGRTWNMGNNLAYGLLFASDGGSWTNLAGGNNTAPNGYYAYAIGYDMRSGQDSSTSTVNQYRKDFSGRLYKDTGESNKIYLMKAQDMANFSTLGYYDMSGLAFDGYTLKQLITQGWVTAGMLESGLVDGKPVYRQETVEYLANLLYETLIIPPFDSDGDYNYNFVKGARSSQFAFDINGDGDLEDRFDLTGDTYAETAEASMDLATALRICLGVQFTFGTDKGSYADGVAARGTYADTLDKADSLVGAFKTVRGNISTCVDAAYYLLANIFVDDSYNQLQDDYGYLTLSGVTLDDGREAYVFDAGFTTGTGKVTASGYADSSQSALDYSPYVKVEDGQTVYGDGTISLENVNSKDKVSINDSDSADTTRFPFLPVTDTEGDYPDETESSYFADDGILNYSESGESYESRNFNYVMASNGEFVYYEDDALFFEFEGDDDVYLFLNDQLVLDIGGAHGITKAKMSVNDYVEWARGIKADATAYAALTKAERDRVDALALTEGQICSFDFYYMERHGYGANCRIVTNMHVTDPSLGVEKNATQFGEKVEYGGAVDGSSPIGYEFKLTNTGNTKLYNLTFTDDIIGVTLDPENGLTVAKGMNGSHVRDVNGGTLEATDLTAVVVGTNDAGETTTVDITFSSNEELKSFLKSLQADGTESGLEDAEITNSGSGLWVGSSVSIKGMYYVMTLSQVENGGMENIVYVTATTKYEPTDAGNETLRSDAKHRVYTSGAPVYYQWAGHELFLQHQEMTTDAIVESVNTDSQLNKYHKFFDKIDITNSSGVVTGADLSKVVIGLCDKYGNPISSETGVSQGTDAAGNVGHYIAYPNAGTYSFHVLIHLNDSNGGYAAGTKASAMAEDTFAIIRVTVYVADVEDSVFVLDYGLKTESLDAGGALFKDDELFGSSGTMQAKLMGVSTSQPSYLSARSYSAGNRIVFSSLGTGDMRKIIFPDGYFNMNVAIDSDGKDISFDAATGTYSLTEIGTVRLNADVPSEWTDVRAYYWYDNGANNGWPGTPMTKVDENGSAYYLDIPADVGYVIINNGNDDQKTDDLEITPGMESSITVSAKSAEDTYYPAVVSNVVKYADAHVTVPSSWQKVYLYCWRDDGTFLNSWPGEEMTKGSDGKYTGKIPSETSYVIVNDGGINQTDDLDVLAGKEVWISLDSEAHGVRDDGKNLFSATMAYNQSSYTVHAKVPDSWGGAYLHYWLTGTADGATEWPGVAMTKGTDGWYSVQVPAGVSYMVVNSGSDADPNQDGVQVSYQTVDLTVNAGLEAWITVDPDWDYQYGATSYYKAHVAYSAEGEDAGFTFTPTDFLETESSIWLALTVHTTGEVPSELSSSTTTGTIDINNEVQMFKKVTVVPASVIYYEDDFQSIDRATDAGGFQHHGEGSGALTQSVDQDIPYGQDPTYQDAANSLYSGDSMTQFKITGYDKLAEFTFTGTGFELIGRTDASKSGIIVVEVFETVTAADGTVTKKSADHNGDGTIDASDHFKYFPVINEFDNGANGGEEGIYQVPVVRVKDLAHGTYIVEISANPTYDFDKWEAQGGDI